MILTLESLEKNKIKDESENNNSERMRGGNIYTRVYLYIRANLKL